MFPFFSAAMVMSENRQGFVDGIGESGRFAAIACKHLAISLC
jgi:hypothetical protein